MNTKEQSKQKILRNSVIALVVVGLLIGSWMTISDFIHTNHSHSNIYASALNLPMDGIDPQEIWVDQIRQENDLVHGKVDFIQEMLVKRVKVEDEQNDYAQNEIKTLRDELNHLRSELKNNSSNQVSVKENLRSELSKTVTEYQQDSWNPFSTSFEQPPLMQELVAPLAMVSCAELINLHHINRTIPTGTSVKAILLSSVDMPCGVKGGTDPLPVKLRIIADGRLPHSVRALLKSGIVTASVYGDLSSERVYFRLEKLTQVRADGYYIETQVAGYISGEDGKYGLRGVVVDKSSQLIENALLSGFLSGASDFFQATATARLYPLNCVEGPGNSNWKQTSGQFAVAGGSGGVANALDALTDYFIKRAEQIRPVIQITPGRIVDITFLESADLGDLYTHERVRNSGKTDSVCGS